MRPLGINPAENGGRIAVPRAERRRRVRHRVHIPAYASLDRQSSRWALELSVILDLSEEGMAVQTAFPLKNGESKNFSLDLPETNTLIQASGTVVWSDASGRTGIRFDPIDRDSLQALQRWLFANAIFACANHVVEKKDKLEPEVLQLKPALPKPAKAARADYTSLLAALAAVKREVEALGTDLDGALHLIARRAHSFTGSSGAAIGLSDGTDMICRATAGPDAPALGARIKVGSGFSGECVRSGTTMRCDDAQNDPRVDRDTCRALGIRSMVAVPIRRQGVVNGLLEVFAPEANAFGADQEAVLRRLAEIVSYARDRAEAPQLASAATARASVDDEFPVETPADLPLPQLSHSRNLVLIGAAVTLVFVVVWLAGTWNSGSTVSSVAPQVAKPVAQAAPTPTSAVTFDGLRKLAEQGDSTAQFAVGAHYAAGEDVPQDYAEALRWFSLAADRGHVPAQSALGGFYWAGRGVPVDLSKAYFWSLLAEAGGDDGSKQRVALLASRLSRSQILAAQQQANEWLRQHQNPPSR